MAVFRQNKSKHRFFFYANSLSLLPASKNSKPDSDMPKRRFAKLNSRFGKLKRRFVSGKCPLQAVGMF